MLPRRSYKLQCSYELIACPSAAAGYIVRGNALCLAGAMDATAFHPRPYLPRIADVRARASADDRQIQAARRQCYCPLPLTRRSPASVFAKPSSACMSADTSLNNRLNLGRANQEGTHRRLLIISLSIIDTRAYIMNIMFMSIFNGINIYNRPKSSPVL